MTSFFQENAFSKDSMALIQKQDKDTSKNKTTDLFH